MKKNIYFSFFVFFSILAGLRIFLWFFPAGFFFGIDILSFLPFPGLLFFTVLCLLCLSQSVNEGAEKVLRRTGDFFYTNDGALRPARAGILLAFSAIVFSMLRVKPYLGDGVSRVLDLGKSYIHGISAYFAYRSYQALSYFLHDMTSSVIVSLGFPAYFSFYFYDVVSGVVFLLFTARMVRFLASDNLQRIVILAFIVCQAYLILFMGYIEYYSIPFALSSMYVYYALLFLEKRSPLWKSGVVLLIICLFHLLGLFLFPSFLFLAVMKAKDRSHVKRFFQYEYPRMLIFSLLTVALIVLAVRPEPLNNLLIDPGDLLSYYNYGPFILFHLSGIANILLLGAAGGCLLLALFGKELLMNIKNSPFLNFLAINAGCAFLFLLVFNPSGNLAADWDIMTIPLYLINLLGIVLFVRYTEKIIPAGVHGILVCQTAIICAAWITVNVMSLPAARRINYIMNHADPAGNPGNPLYTDGQTFKYYYLIEKDYGKCREIANICLENVENESLWEYANYMKEIGDDGIALRFVEKYVRYLEKKIGKDGSSWSDHYNVAMNGYMILGRFGEAARSFRSALDRNSRNYELYFWIGQAYESDGDFPEAAGAYIAYDDFFDEGRAMKLADRGRTLEKIFQMARHAGTFEMVLNFFTERRQRGAIYAYYLGLLYYQNHETDKTEKIFDEIRLSRVPLGDYICADIARIFMEMGKLASAWELLQLNKHPESKVWLQMEQRIKNTEWYRNSGAGDKER